MNAMATPTDWATTHIFTTCENHNPRPCGEKGKKVKQTGIFEGRAAENLRS